MFSIYEITELAARIEENGANFYRHMHDEVESPELKSLFHWLADTEMEHRQWFAQLNEELKPKKDRGELEAIGGSILQEIMGTRTFSLEQEDISRVHKVEDLIQIAGEFEKDTVLFYQILKGLVDDQETRRCLDRIIKEEEHHIQVLKDLWEKKDDSSPPKSIPGKRITTHKSRRK